MCGGIFLGYDGIIKQFNIFTILLSISLSLSHDRYDRAAYDFVCMVF